MISGIETHLAERWMGLLGVIAHLYAVTDPSYQNDGLDYNMQIDLDSISKGPLLGLGLGYFITIIAFFCELIWFANSNHFQ